MSFGMIPLNPDQKPDGFVLLSMYENLESENAELRELVRDMYERFYGVVIENWSYSSEDFYMYERRLRELGVEVDE